MSIDLTICGFTPVPLQAFVVAVSEFGTEFGGNDFPDVTLREAIDGVLGRQLSTVGEPNTMLLPPCVSLVVASLGHRDVVVTLQNRGH